MSFSSGSAAYAPAAASPWAGGGWRPAFGNRWAWLAITLLAFAAWWPLGLASIALMVGNGRFGGPRNGRRAAAWAARMSNCCNGQRSTGNRAFDDYRDETLKRLEEEQREFAEFLERLRVAKDKSEFDAFMSERRQRPQQPEAAS
jgi:hypothetical protein